MAGYGTTEFMEAFEEKQADIGMIWCMEKWCAQIVVVVVIVVVGDFMIFDEALAYDVWFLTSRLAFYVRIQSTYKHTRLA